jgi:hypothetical protein
VDKHNIEYLFYIHVIIILTGVRPRRPGRIGKDIDVNEERVRREKRIIVV